MEANKQYNSLECSLSAPGRGHLMVPHYGSIYIISFCRSIGADVWLVAAFSYLEKMRSRHAVGHTFRISGTNVGVYLCQNGLIQFVGILWNFDVWFFTAVDLCMFAIIMQSTLPGSHFLGRRSDWYSGWAAFGGIMSIEIWSNGWN